MSAQRPPGGENPSPPPLLALSSKQVEEVVHAVGTFAEELTDNFATAVKAQPEDQLKSPVQALVTRVGRAIGVTVGSRTEATALGVGGRPDIGVTVDRLLSGHVELKRPGYGADARKFKGRDKAQFERFAAFPNLMYTDSRAWMLFRHGRAISSFALTTDPTTAGRSGTSKADAVGLANILGQFLEWQPVVPSSAADLARLLAPLARLLRDEVMTDVKQDGALATLAGDWRKVFYPDATDQMFADAYAQTLTYALLMARIEGAPAPCTAHLAAAHLDADHSVLAQVLRVLAQPAARAAIEMPVELLERTISAVDSLALMKAGRDPWLYFYEDFLSEYDPKQRNRRGVYFTPLPVVGAQVRSAEHLLRSRFKMDDGFAAPEVTVLDPACGTGTYPLEIVNRVATRVQARGVGLVPEVLTRLANNLFAFEILVGPYAVSHLRLTSVLRDAGAALPAGGARVFLTDTLSEPVGPGHVKSAPLFEKPLAEEQLRASNVKAATEILCCIGNPPYNRDASGESGGRRKGGIVRYPFGHRKTGLIGDYLERLPLKTRSRHALHLYNDYVYFWRWATWKVLEQHPESGGIVSFITASSYLTGDAFGGMREHLRRLCDEIWIIDLGGDGRGAPVGVVDDNVFDIRTPVAIAVAVRHPGDPEPLRDRPAKVFYRRIYGTRIEKYEALDRTAEFDPTDSALWDQAESDWQTSFVPPPGGRYQEWISLDVVFPWSARGIQFSRTWPVAESPAVCGARWNALVTANPKERPGLLIETRDAKVSNRYPSFLKGGLKLQPINTLDAGSPPDGLEPISFRSFDTRYCVADRRVIDLPRPALWSSRGPQQVFLTSLHKQAMTAGPALLACAHVPDLNSFNNRGGIVFPLWRDVAATEANVSAALLKRLQFDSAVSAEDVVAYVYGLLGTAAFSSRYGPQLEAGAAPRVPFTSDWLLFCDVVALGRKLLWLHTFGQRFVPDGVQPGTLQAGSARNTKPVGPELPDEVAFDANTQTIRVGAGEFAPVTHEQWQYSVSGYQVIPSWISARLASRKGASELDTIVPDRWEQSSALLDLLWVVEQTIELTPDAGYMLHLVAESSLFDMSDLENPAGSESSPPVPRDPLAAELPFT